MKSFISIMTGLLLIFSLISFSARVVPERSFAQEATGSVSSDGAAASTERSLTVLPSEGELVKKIQSGQIHLSDIPAFISFFIELSIIVAGIISFLMIIVGGYQYIIGGVYSDMKEKGKSTLTYAIGGFILSLIAYGIVKIIQLAVTAL